MFVRRVSIALAVAVVVSCVFTSPATAGLSPYLCVDWGASQLRMSETNADIAEAREVFERAAVPATYDDIGVAWGPGVSAGLRLFPALRIGATWASGRSVRHNGAYQPGAFLYLDDYEFRTTEIGGEAALRIASLRGFAVGGHVGRTRAEVKETHVADDAHGYYEEHQTGDRTTTTWGAWLGFDQTNEYGLVGFVRVGWQARDVGAVPTRVRTFDGFGETVTDGTSMPLDFSGVYVKVGTGFELRR